MDECKTAAALASLLSSVAAPATAPHLDVIFQASPLHTLSLQLVGLICGLAFVLGAFLRQLRRVLLWWHRNLLATEQKPVGATADVHSQWMAVSVEQMTHLLAPGLLDTQFEHDLFAAEQGLLRLMPNADGAQG